MAGVALLIDASAGAPSYSGRAFRQGMAGMKGWDGVPLAGRQGIRPMGGSSANIVTLSGSTITVNLHAGEITPGWAAVTGTYDVALTVAETHSLTPADATNPRKDIVVGRVYDHSESASSLRLYRSEYIVGTAGPSPSEPSVPQGAIRLATIDVPASGGGSPVVTANYQLTAAAGGILPVRSVTERDAIASPYTGQVIYRMDKGWLEFYDSTGAWRTHRAIVAAGVLGDITHPTAGQAVFFTSTKVFQYYTGSAWVPLTIAHQQQASGFVGSISSASYVSASGDPAITFTAPASGQVWVGIGAAIASAADSTGRAAFDMWTGSTPGSGTLVHAASDSDSIAWQGATAWEAGRPPSLVTGLTAGSTYSVRMVYKRDSGTVTVGFARRRITVRDA